MRDVYTVQIEASVDQNLVMKHLAVMKQKGIDARVEPFHKGAVTWYRLRAGAFKTPAEAKTLLAQLKWTEKSFASRGPAVFFNDKIVI